MDKDLKYEIIRKLNSNGNTILKLTCEGRYVKFVTKEEAKYILRHFKCEVIDE